jgi:hypothetical protein
VGKDRLVGGPGGDLLIAGSTIYDGDAQALCTIVRAWTDAACYGTRVARLTGGVDGVRLTAETVLDDGVEDKLTGASGADWFFATVEGKRRDKVTDRHHGERLTALTPIAPAPAPNPCKPVIDWDRDDDHHDGKRERGDHHGNHHRNRHDDRGEDRKHGDHRDDDHPSKDGWVKDFVLDLGGHDANKDIQIVPGGLARRPHEAPRTRR